MKRNKIHRHRRQLTSPETHPVEDGNHGHRQPPDFRREDEDVGVLYSVRRLRKRKTKKRSRNLAANGTTATDNNNTNSPPQVTDVLGKIPETTLAAVRRRTLQQPPQRLARTEECHAPGIQSRAERPPLPAHHDRPEIPAPRGIGAQDVRRLGDRFEHGQIEAVEFVRPREEDVDHAPTEGDHPDAIADCRRRRPGFPYRIGRGAAATAVATPLRRFRNVV